MAKRSGLRVTCAVCRRVFYVSGWGDTLPDHATGRGSAPACGGSRRADYLPASQDAVEAQLSWASQNVPTAPKKRSVPARAKARTDNDKKRAQRERELERQRRSLDELVDEGLRLSESRRDSEGHQAIDALERHQRLLAREMDLRRRLLDQPAAD